MMHLKIVPQRLSCDHLDKATSSKSKPAKYDDLLTRAAEATRLSLNSRHLAQCPDLPASTQLNHAKTSATARGIEKNVLELTFDGSAVISAIIHRLANATDMPAEDTNEQFVLMSSVPGPCDQHAADQLAISYAGACAACYRLH
jgi:membrane-bound lytic murein transglycosylase B